jgi:hypothetical protein
MDVQSITTEHSTRRKEITSFVYKNTVDIQLRIGKGKHGELAGVASAKAISYFYPGLKGGNSNAHLDGDQLLKFIRCDLHPIKLWALKWAREHA